MIQIAFLQYRRMLNTSASITIANINGVCVGEYDNTTTLTHGLSMMELLLARLKKI